MSLHALAEPPTISHAYSTKYRHTSARLHWTPLRSIRYDWWSYCSRYGCNASIRSDGRALLVDNLALSSRSYLARFLSSTRIKVSISTELRVWYAWMIEYGGLIDIDAIHRILLMSSQSRPARCSRAAYHVAHVSNWKLPCRSQASQGSSQIVSMRLNVSIYLISMSCMHI